MPFSKQSGRGVPSLLLAWLSTALLACASRTALSTEDREALQRELRGENRERFLRLSYYVTSFFGDGSKKLLTPVPPEEVQFSADLGGGSGSPGPVEQVLPAGTHGRILKVEFPTAWAVAHRPPDTPRDHPWIYLHAERQNGQLPLILVLPTQIQSREDFESELERYLCPIDPTALMSDWTEGIREAVRTKNAVVDMPTDALEMAWGYPERKRVFFEEATRKEEWSYPGGKRVAFIADGRVTRAVR
ncbi:MAG TPA: hypothetical protein VN918_05580 [Myxococcaceae bacterium]|nr:hypothetical protein [Myxococcaceae bacterium]